MLLLLSQQSRGMNLVSQQHHRLLRLSQQSSSLTPFMALNHQGPPATVMGTYPHFYFGGRTKLAFGTERPQQSNKYHRGLFHKKTHGQRRQRCFSMKYSLITMKPNVMRRSFFSQILGMNLRVWVSMKARRTIMKKGSFDNYILSTNSKTLDSKFGVYIKSLIK